MLLISRPPDIPLPTGHEFQEPRIRRKSGMGRHLTPYLSAERRTGPPISPALGLCVLIGLLLAAALLLSGGVVNAQETEPADLGYDEEEALSIDRMLICPVCPAETIDQAQVELSRQMRRIVREMLAQWGEPGGNPGLLRGALRSGGAGGPAQVRVQPAGLGRFRRRAFWPAWWPSP